MTAERGRGGELGTLARPLPLPLPPSLPTRQWRQASEETAASTPSAMELPQCGSLSTMEMPWSPMSHERSRGEEEEEDDEEEEEEETQGDRGEQQEDDDEIGEFVRYGDRLCLLCDGQVLALTRKFNLSYEQMALLAAATIVSGGLMGVASFFIWRKGLFRMRYAALLSDLVYKDGAATSREEDADEMHRKMEAMMRADNRSAAAVTSLSERPNNTTGPVDGADAVAPTASSSSSSPSATDAKSREQKARAVTFRIFQYDEQTHSIKYASLGQPVQFDTPLIIAHAASRRAIRYKPHRGAVTISRPPRNLHFRRSVKESVADIDTTLQSLYQHENQDRKRNDQARDRERSETSRKPRPQSLTMTIFKRVMGRDRSEPVVDPVKHRGKPPVPASMPGPSLGRPSTRSEASSFSSTRIRRRASQPHFYGSTCSTTREPGVAQDKSLYRSISESCLSIVRNLNDSVQVQKEKRALQKRRRMLLKDVPNMAFPESDGQYFVARLRPPILPLFRSESTGRDHPQLLPEVQPFLRWGAPMQLVAAYNDSPCGFHSREYYRDPQQYMSTERTACSPATMIPIPESGNLQAIAKESIRRLAHLEKRQVKIRVGTYNVWMMPRKISTFTNVSPKKNTRAKLIADLLPPCDVWVFTECFDHRARSVLLDRLKSDGGYYFNSPTVGHKRRGPDGRYLDKLLNGGVVLASKYPILAVRIKLFREISAGSDRFADKGVLYCKILKDGLLVHIFSTHLQAWNDDVSRAARRQQLQLIAQLMASMDIDPRMDCVMFVGDLNVNMWLNNDNHEYDEMLEILDARDTSMLPSKLRGKHESTADDFKRGVMYSFDGRVNPLAGNGLSSDGSLELLDYVLYSRSHRQPSHASSWVQPVRVSSPWMWKKQPQYDLSDHFPVLSELTFDMWRD